LLTAPSFRLNFKGVTSSKGALMVQGYSPDNNLNKYRNHLKEALKKSALKQDVDGRYILKTAHMTTVRFSQSIQNPKNFIQVFQQYRNVDFGHVQPSNLALVYNDWYHKKKNTKVLKQFSV